MSSPASAASKMRREGRGSRCLLRAPGSPSLGAGRASPGMTNRKWLLDFVALKQRQRVRFGRRDPPQGVGVAMIEGRRLTFDGQIRARHIAPAAVIVERDVDAVIVGAEGFIQEGGGADAE